MIVLQDTNDTIEVVLAGAITTSQLQCTVSWRDITTTGYTPGGSRANTNSTTPVTLVAAPGASTQRVIDLVTVYNADTVNATVTITLDDNGTGYVLCKVTLGAGETLQYVEGYGFQKLTTQGAVANALVATNYAISSSLSSVVLGSDITNNNASANTIADVTGLSFSVTGGNTYYFKFVIPYTSAATTTGSRWSINGPSSPTFLYFWSQYSLTTTTQTTNGGLSSYDTPAASNASSAATGSNIAIVEGFIKPSSSGTVIARFASEVSSSAIVAKTGAVCYYQQIA